MSALGSVKATKKQLKARAKRFATEEVAEAPKKVFSHSEGFVRLSGDPVQKLVDLCKRKLAAGEELTMIQKETLVRYGIDPFTLPQAEAQPPRALSAGKAANPRKRQRSAGPASSGGVAKGSSPIVIKRTGLSDGSSNGLPVPSPTVVLRRASVSSTGGEGEGEGLRQGAAAGAGAAVHAASGASSAAGDASHSHGVSGSIDLLAGLPPSGDARLTSLNRLVRRLGHLNDKKLNNQPLTPHETAALAQRDKVLAALLNETAAQASSGVARAS